MNKLIEGIDRLADDEYMKRDTDERYYMDYARLYHEYYWVYKNINEAKPIIDQINPATHDDLEDKELLECVSTLEKGMRVAAVDCIRAIAKCDEWLQQIRTSQAAKGVAERTKRLKEVQHEGHSS